MHDESGGATRVPVSNGSNNNDAIEFTATERRNLEFAQKLGYSDQIVHTALVRLGSEAKQNELLAELIKLSADEPKLAAAPNGNGNSNSIKTAVGGGSGVATGAASQLRLRPIVIDGSNVALAHGNNEVFSCRGIRICVEWFRQRGHKEINAFVPQWRKESSRALGAHHTVADKEVLYELERERVLVFTPSRLLEGGKRVSCYDDRYVLKLAAETDGIVVSNDNYRDLALENAEFRRVVQERLLMYSFVNDRFMPPDDPMGRSGPTLDVFLRHRPPPASHADSLPVCPYGKKCTYGSKCKFRHQPPSQAPHNHHSHALLQRASLSAPLNFNQQPPNGSAAVLSTNSNKQVQQPLGRAKSITADKPHAHKHSQALGGSMRGSSTALDEKQLSSAFNGALALDLQHKDETNRHKKLQRQLPTHNHQLNPQPHHQMLMSTVSAPPAQQLPCSIASLANNSGGCADKHALLTRIPSAPVAPAAEASINKMSLQPMHNYAFLSSSDSRISDNLHRSHTRTRAEKRGLLKYHLSNLFPLDQVEAVMQMYPEETEARLLCTAILNLFPSN